MGSNLTSSLLNWKRWFPLEQRNMRMQPRDQMSAGKLYLQTLVHTCAQNFELSKKMANLGRHIVGRSTAGMSIEVEGVLSFFSKKPVQAKVS